MRFKPRHPLKIEHDCGKTFGSFYRAGEAVHICTHMAHIRPTECNYTHTCRLQIKVIAVPAGQKIFSRARKLVSLNWPGAQNSAL